MKHPIVVAERNTLVSATLLGVTGTYSQQLVCEVLDRIKVEGAAVAVRVHVSLQVLLAELDVQPRRGSLLASGLTSKMRTSLDSV